MCPSSLLHLCQPLPSNLSTLLHFFCQNIFFFSIVLYVWSPWTLVSSSFNTKIATLSYKHDSCLPYLALKRTFLTFYLILHNLYFLYFTFESGISIGQASIFSCWYTECSTSRWPTCKEMFYCILYFLCCILCLYFVLADWHSSYISTQES